MSLINAILHRFINLIGSLRLALGLELFIGLSFAIVSLFFFGWFADEMAEGDTARFDETFRAFVHSFAAPFLTSMMQAASFAGSTLFLILFGIVVVIALYVKKHKHGALLFTITTLGASALLFLLKLAFHRARPEPFYDTILPASYSFPSGHSLGSFCFYLALAAILTNRVDKFWLKITIWTLAVSLVLLIGISRIYLGVHYPSDVLAGFVVGFIWVVTIAVGDKLIHARKAKVE